MSLLGKCEQCGRESEYLDYEFWWRKDDDDYTEEEQKNLGKLRCSDCDHAANWSGWYD